MLWLSHQKWVQVRQLKSKSMSRIASMLSNKTAVSQLQQELQAMKHHQEQLEKERKLELQSQERELERHRREQQVLVLRNRERSRESKSLSSFSPTQHSTTCPFLMISNVTSQTAHVCTSISTFSEVLSDSGSGLISMKLWVQLFYGVTRRL